MFAGIAQDQRKWEGGGGGGGGVNNSVKNIEDYNYVTERLGWLQKYMIFIILKHDELYRYD